MRKAAVASLSLLFACGGKVVVDGARTEGGGAGGSPSQEEIAAVCTAYCDRWASDGCKPTAGPCEEWCPQIAEWQGPCLDEYLDVYRCSASEGFNGTPICLLSGACLAAKEARMACVYPAGPCDLESHECDHGPDGAVCNLTCGGSIYQTDCDPTRLCTCRVDGKVVGTCQEVDLSGDCCDQHFAVSKDGKP